MSALPNIEATARQRRAFTLTELLVVIAIIVLLVSILLAALGLVQKKAEQTRTEATMQAFINACDTFYQEHGFYPGVVPENILAANASSVNFTSTENALLHLMGGYVREEDFTNAAAFDNASGTEITFGNYRIKVDKSKIGNGPVINGKSYAPYFTPGDREFAQYDQRVHSGGNLIADDFALPDLLDAWGNPILYMRRVRDTGTLVTSGTGAGQFDLRSIYHFANMTGISRETSSYLYKSLIAFDPGDESPADANLARLLEHPSLPNQSRGAYLVLSAGVDGTYLAYTDGAGDTENPETDISDPDEYPARVLDEYDDVIRFGGS